MVELPGAAQNRGGDEKKQKSVLDQSWYLELWNAVSGR